MEYEYICTFIYFLPSLCLTIILNTTIYIYVYICFGTGGTKANVTIPLQYSPLSQQYRKPIVVITSFFRKIGKYCLFFIIKHKVVNSFKWCQKRLHNTKTGYLKISIKCLAIRTCHRLQNYETNLLHAHCTVKT